MSKIFSATYVRYSFIFLYGIILAFFLGKLVGVIIPFLAWPYNVVLGYLLGATGSVLFVFILLRKWQIVRRQKIIVAIGTLITIAVLSVFISLWSLHITKMRAIEVLGCASSHVS